MRFLEHNRFDICVLFAGRTYGNKICMHLVSNGIGRGAKVITYFIQCCARAISNKSYCGSFQQNYYENRRRSMKEMICSANLYMLVHNLVTNVVCVVVRNVICQEEIDKQLDQYVIIYY